MKCGAWHQIKRCGCASVPWQVDEGGKRPDRSVVIRDGAVARGAEPSLAPARIVRVARPEQQPLVGHMAASWLHLASFGWLMVR
jgi:hypothetical protein